MPTPEELYDQQMLSGDNLPTNIYMQKPPPTPQKQTPKPKLKNYQVLLKQSSKLNKKIIEFFKRNLLSLNKSGYTFEWISVDEEEIDFYAEQDIDKFPSIIIDDNVIAGVSNITTTLQNFINPNPNNKGNNNNNNNNNNPNKQVAKKTNTESDLKDYFMNEIDPKGKNADNDDDEHETMQINMHKRAADMLSKRSSMGLENPNNGTAANPEVHEQRTNDKSNIDHTDRNEVTHNANLNTTNLIKKNAVTEDDKMEAAFWSNMEESDY
jgi:hypothetical protein